MENSTLSETHASERASEEPVAAETCYASSSEEADRRSKKYRGRDIDLDPFPDTPRALLSSEHIREYVRETGMIFPFHDLPGRLKSASYEVYAGHQFIYWREDGTDVFVHVRRSSRAVICRGVPAAR
jgi:hypothetical protein